MLTAALALCALAAPVAQAYTPLVSRPYYSLALTDRTAALRVHRSAFEPRRDNHAANHRVPTRYELAYFRRHEGALPWAYKSRVTGYFRGTTDEVIQWAAIKWGFNPELFRAVAAVESWWHMYTVGNDGDAFGLFQVRRPYHCCWPLTARSTAFNADYYGAELRAAYNGAFTWLNTVPHGRYYRRGDLWGSVGEWASGRWHLGTSDWYVGQVQQRLSQRIWFDRWF